MKHWLAAIFIVLLLATLSCRALSGGGTGEESDVLFQDDFSDPSSGWDRITLDDGETNYVDGVYRIFVNTASTDVWANPGLDFTDVKIEVEATKVGGADDNDFGVICRSQDEDNFYFFIISSDGYYGIGKVVGDSQALIGMDAMQPSEEIRQGEATNLIRADCAGSRLALYVNGEMLYEVEDAQFASGDVGLMAGTFDTPGTDIHFDNFVVTRP